MTSFIIPKEDTKSRLISYLPSSTIFTFKGHIYIKLEHGCWDITGRCMVNFLSDELADKVFFTCELK